MLFWVDYIFFSRLPVEIIEAWVEDKFHQKDFVCFWQAPGGTIKQEYL